MLKILIVEDDELFATTLRGLVELNPRYQVTAVVHDREGVTAAIDERLPDLALVDLHLANGDSGYLVAADLVEADVACLFVTGRPSQVPLPDLALGVLVKPFGEGELSQALRTAEDLIRGRQRIELRENRPDNLTLYGEGEAAPVPVPELAEDPQPKARLLAWVETILKR